MVVVFIVIFNGLDSQERGAQNHRQDQTHDRRPALANLRAVDSHGHRETAHDQDSRIDGAELDVQVVAGANECRRILAAIERVSQEHAAEEHDLGNEKYPHAQRARLSLLLHILEVMAQRRMRSVIVSCS